VTSRWGRHFVPLFAGQPLYISLLRACCPQARHTFLLYGRPARTPLPSFANLFPYGSSVSTSSFPRALTTRNLYLTFFILGQTCLREAPPPQRPFLENHAPIMRPSLCQFSDPPSKESLSLHYVVVWNSKTLPCFFPLITHHLVLFSTVRQAFRLFQWNFP